MCLLQVLNAEVAGHQQSIQAQTTKLNRLEQQLSEAQQLSAQLDASLSAARAELRASRDKVTSLEEANRKLNEEVEAGVQLSVDVVNLKSELDSAQRQQGEQQLASRSKLNKFGLQVSSSISKTIPMLVDYTTIYYCMLLLIYGDHVSCSSPGLIVTKYSTKRSSMMPSLMLNPHTLAGSRSGG